ncbi:glycoside hydrolase family 23 protein [Phanerochaete carnosa HHB-10118-sp]|uniref:Glycoside hydrolase family 23 protein n=1 Tax=Phanerochaete carnosa (strain HHB-10118-sp) TaxID=650164 RepID=K5W6C7_PHACS|nr:glycoside hydrolase family 23 protein [Phanerochaete carnosa HHB-10118-sp]EKM54504.1 glycoside hydrolase family 23 protein [Phanerochaete carnosa HHB-10118-sp]
MKLSAPFVGLILAVGAAQAAFPHAEGGLSAREHHKRLGNHARDLVNGRTIVRPRRRSDGTKKCKAKTSSLGAPPSSTAAAPAPAQTSPASTESAAVTTSAAPSPPPSEAPATTSAAPSPPPSEAPATTSVAPPPPPPASSSSAASAASESAGAFALNTLTSSECGASGATEQITATAGPNGAESWLNCGIQGAGWNPPPMQVSDVVSKDLNDALSEPNSPFANCEPYVSYFYQYGGQYGVPPIFLASIAMQESSCDPTKTGGAGEQGLMQITVDKCGAAPNGNCKDPNYNIQQGALFLSGLISDNGGNVLLAVGQYNGWVNGMTEAQATAAADTGCCPCQNNLDYLMQFFNGWVLGTDPTASPRLGQFFNLDICGTGQ